MTIDMKQFHQTFFEESFEGLDVMESELLDLKPGNSDPEVLNAIFRAAHSIKGGSGTFGFSAVTEFTHVLETILDQMRNGQMAIQSDVVETLLLSVDVLRELLTDVRDENDIDHVRVDAMREKMQAIIDNKPVPQAEAGASQTESPSNAKESSGRGWAIDFKPYPDLLRSGNDPVGIFEELNELGELDVVANVDKLSGLQDMHAEECYLSWCLNLATDADEAAVVEAFDWVEGECDLSIEPLGTDSSAVSDSAGTALADMASADQQMSPADGEMAESKAPVLNYPDRRTVDIGAPSNTGERRKKQPAGDASIRVGVDKIDDLINMVGELVITQSMLGQIADDFSMSKLERLMDGLKLLERNTREIQENVMRIRMLPISFVFNRFPRLVHDLSGKLGKKIELRMLGESTELDKNVMEKISDPLVHLVRNSLDHGIEQPDDRVAKGKPETGVLTLNAFHQGGNIVIEISDDGAGLNAEKIFNKAVERGLVKPGDSLPQDKIYELIMEPGFSTAEAVSDVSGRGVGMDVVRQNIEALGGSVELASELDRGTTMTIRLPLTLAILDGQSVQVGDETYIIPLVSIVESVLVEEGELVSRVAGQAEVFRLRDEYLPIVRLYQLFNLTPKTRVITDGLVVVVEGNNQKIGLFVDDLLGQQQVVIKSLETNYKRLPGISGATILGDGSVSLILDIPGLIKLGQSMALPTEPNDPTFERKRLISAA